jgi:uncharacterized membrane protein
MTPPRFAMRHVWDTFLKGLATVLPVTLTVYFVYWLALFMENIFRQLITALLPDRFYVPGMGLIVGVIMLYFIGLAVDAWVVKRVLRVGDRLLERIPFIKTVYGALRDFMEYFSSHKRHSGMKQVVMVSIGDDMRLLGFVTRENNNDTAGLELADDIIAVYFPMSYQIGGYTVYIPRSRVEPINMPIEDAMRLVLTAGVSVVRETDKPTEAPAAGRAPVP